MAAGEEALGAIYGVDEPGADGGTVGAEVEPGDQFGFADGLGEDLGEQGADLGASGGGHQIQELRARFFGDDGVVRAVVLQGAADDGLRAVVGDGDGFAVVAGRFGVGAEIVFLHELAELGGCAQGLADGLHGEVLPQRRESTKSLPPRTPSFMSAPSGRAKARPYGLSGDTASQLALYREAIRRVECEIRHHTF